MKNDQQLFDKIEAYLSGKLPACEAADLELQIREDQALSELVEMHRLERECMEYLVEQDLQQKLKDWETTPPSGGGKKSGNFYWGLLLALLTFGVVVIVFLLIPGERTTDEALPSPEEGQVQEQQQPARTPTRGDVPIAGNTPKKEEEKRPSPKEQTNHSGEYLALAASFYSLPANLGTYLKSGESYEPDNVLNPGLTAFANGRYQQAIAAFDKIDPKQSPAEYELSREYLGHAYFQLGDYEKAASVFEDLAAQSVMTGLDRAEWYLLLSRLPNYDRHKRQVDDLLARMVAPESYHSYATKAGELKARLGL